MARRRRLRSQLGNAELAQGDRLIRSWFDATSQPAQALGGGLICGQLGLAPATTARKISLRCALRSAHFPVRSSAQCQVNASKTYWTPKRGPSRVIPRDVRTIRGDQLGLAGPGDAAAGAIPEPAYAADAARDGYRRASRNAEMTFPWPNP